MSECVVTEFTEHVIDGREEFTNFQQKLLSDGFSFVIRQVKQTKWPPWIIFEYKHSRGIAIPFCGLPFIKKQTTSYECALGTKRYATKSDLPKKPHQYGKTERFSAHETKKMDCPAKMTVSEIWLFPFFKVNDPAHRVLREKVCKDVKDLLSQDTLDGSQILERYYVRLTGEHNHPPSTVYRSQELSHLLKEEIQRLVDDGITDVKTIKTLLKSFVKNNISEDVPEHARAFYPTNKMIYNYASKFKCQTKQSKIDRAPQQFEELDSMDYCDETYADEQNETDPQIVVIAEIRKLAKTIYENSFLLEPNDVDFEVKTRIIQQLTKLSKEMKAIVALEDSIEPPLPLGDVKKLPNKRKKMVLIGETFVSDSHTIPLPLPRETLPESKKKRQSQHQEI